MVKLLGADDVIAPAPKERVAGVRRLKHRDRRRVYGRFGRLRILGHEPADCFS